jgi:hypothetical protein
VEVASCDLHDYDSWELLSVPFAVRSLGADFLGIEGGAV